jgi:hypothetical protein
MCCHVGVGAGGGNRTASLDQRTGHDPML